MDLHLITVQFKIKRKLALLFRKLAMFWFLSPFFAASCQLTLASGHPFTCFGRRSKTLAGKLAAEKGAGKDKWKECA